MLNLIRILHSDSSFERQSIPIRFLPLLVDTAVNEIGETIAVEIFGKYTSGLSPAIKYVVSKYSRRSMKWEEGVEIMRVENLSQLVRQSERTVIFRGRTEMKFHWYNRSNSRTIGGEENRRTVNPPDKWVTPLSSTGYAAPGFFSFWQSHCCHQCLPRNQVHDPSVFFFSPPGDRSRNVSPFLSFATIGLLINGFVGTEAILRFSFVNYSRMPLAYSVTCFL